MKCFDTDVLSDYFRDRPDYVAKVAQVPAAQRLVSDTAMYEVARGSVQGVERAELGRAKVPVAVALSFLVKNLQALREFRPILYSDAAQARFADWRTAKIGVKIRDLRIAATCVAHDVTLVTRNARDFFRVPGLKLEIWP